MLMKIAYGCKPGSREAKGVDMVGPGIPFQGMGSKVWPVECHIHSFIYYLWLLFSFFSCGDGVELAWPASNLVFLLGFLIPLCSVGRDE